MHWKQEFVAAAGSLILALPAFGQAGTGAGAPPAGTPPPPNTATRAPTDKDAAEAAILGVLHKANQDEIAMANLANERSSNKAVKDYAGTITADHKKADDEIMSFAKVHNLDLKEGLHAAKERVEQNREAAEAREVQSATGGYSHAGAAMGDQAAAHKQAMEDLGKLNGPEFDKKFVKTMAVDHRRVIDHLTTIRSKAKDPEFTQLIDKLMPMLQKHESAAQQLGTQLSKAS
jgi:putative membrane protein